MLSVAEGLSGEAPTRLLGPGCRVREEALWPQELAARVPTAMAVRSVTLGIDLGTTSVKAALVEAAPGDPSGFVVLASCARPTLAEAVPQSAAAGPQVRQRLGAPPPPGAS